MNALTDSQVDDIIEAASLPIEEYWKDFQATEARARQRVRDALAQLNLHHDATNE